jgi:hypothetical protein
MWRNFDVGVKFKPFLKLRNKGFLHKVYRFRVDPIESA